MIKSSHEFKSYGERMFGAKMKILLILLFFVIIGLLFYTAFYNTSFLSGDIIKISYKNTPSSIAINTKLNIPEFNLKQEIGKIEINLIGSKGELIFGDEAFSLSKMNQHYLVLENFKGNFFFNDDKILVLDGKANKVILDGFDVSSEIGRRREVKLTQQVSYSSLNLNNLFLDKLSYPCSGKIIFGAEKSVLNTENYKTLFNDFNGSIKIHNNEMNLNGNVESIKISGEESILVK